MPTHAAAAHARCQSGCVKITVSRGLIYYNLLWLFNNPPLWLNSGRVCSAPGRWVTAHPKQMTHSLPTALTFYRALFSSPQHTRLRHKMAIMVGRKGIWRLKPHLYIGLYECHCINRISSLSWNFGCPDLLFLWLIIKIYQKSWNMEIRFHKDSSDIIIVGLSND